MKPFLDFIQASAVLLVVTTASAFIVGLGFGLAIAAFNFGKALLA